MTILFKVPANDNLHSCWYTHVHPQHTNKHIHTPSDTLPGLILTLSYLLIGKADRRREGWVKTHLVINSRSKTKTHFTDQCPLSLLPVWYACAPVCHSSACQSVSLCSVFKTFITHTCMFAYWGVGEGGRGGRSWFTPAQTNLVMSSTLPAGCSPLCCSVCFCVGTEQAASYTTLFIICVAHVT